jgi:hypothetical protein
MSSLFHPSAGGFSAAVFLLSTLLVMGQAKISDWHLQQENRAWLQAFDPTLLSPRLLTKWEHKDLVEGNTIDRVLANTRSSFARTDSILNAQLGF